MSICSRPAAVVSIVVEFSVDAVGVSFAVAVLVVAVVASSLTLKGGFMCASCYKARWNERQRQSPCLASGCSKPQTGGGFCSTCCYFETAPPQNRRRFQHKGCENFVRPTRGLYCHSHVIRKPRQQEGSEGGITRRFQMAARIQEEQEEDDNAGRDHRRDHWSKNIPRSPRTVPFFFSFILEHTFILMHQSYSNIKIK